MDTQQTDTPTETDSRTARQGETDTAGPTPTPRPTGRGSRSDGYPHVVRSFSYPAQHASGLDGAPRKEGFPAWTGYPGSTGPQTRPGTAAAWH